jgi:large subunit ribosomal protein L34e
MARRNRRVSRPYGGNLCHQCLRERIVRAFLVEEVKIVKKIMG